MSESSSLVFYTVTNQHYFPGTIATVSSIRTFHPGNPIFVVSESRTPLTPEQVRYLRSLPGVHYLAEAEVPVGAIHEAWQMKAHAARHLADQYHGILVQVDSDAVLCAPIDRLAAEAAARGVPVGGKDGRGVAYPYPEYGPYQTLCGRTVVEQSHYNPHYVSSSVLVLPITPMQEIFTLWSVGVDKGIFGPGWQKEKLYAGRGDQGILNAILFFKNITPLAIDNEIISEHWTHGRNPLTFRDGRFWNGQKEQISFHSVGHAPKFWTAGYRDYVTRVKNLEPVYRYWLGQLFDGPCGLLARHSPDQLRQLSRALFPPSSPDLLAEYFERRTVALSG